MKVNTKVKLEAPKPAMAPSRSLPRSASELADPPSPFSSNPAHHPVSVPITPTGLSCASFGRMRSPPNDKHHGKPKPTPAPAAGASSYYSSLWSPRRLMQRAARAFRRSKSSRSGHVRTVKDLAEERASVLSASSKASDAAAVAPPAAAAVGSVQAGPPQQRHDDEIVPEKIILEDAPPVPVVVAEEEETAAAATTEEEVEVEVESPKKGAAPEPEPEVESPKKGAAPEPEPEVESPKKGAAPAPEPEPEPETIVAAPAPEPEPEAIVAAPVEDDAVADKFVTVVKEAIKKQQHEAAGQEQDEKKEAMRRFQGSRVKTAMEARPESEQPRRREVARSDNDVIEEARTKLLAKRQGSRVKALVGAFETVMDTKKEAAAVTGKPLHHYRKSA